MRQHSCIAFSRQVYSDVRSFPIAWRYHRERCHDIVLCTTLIMFKSDCLWKIKGVEENIIKHLIAEGTRESHLVSMICNKHKPRREHVVDLSNVFKNYIYTKLFNCRLLFTCSCHRLHNLCDEWEGGPCKTS